MTPSARILIVEDEMLVALDLERRMKKLGYDVCGVFTTGEEAVQETGARSPNVVLMDICLPGEIDGVEAARRIVEYYDVPVIYLSANADDITLKRAKLTQADAYLLKPFRERELQIAIEMALVNHKLRQELRRSHDLLEHRVIERTADLERANEALSQEIAERRRAEAAARERAALLDKARDAILVRDLRGRILYCNSSAERLYAIAPGQAAGRLADELFQEFPLSEAEGDPVATALEKGEWLGRLTHAAPGGEEIVVESRWTLVRDEAGQPVSFFIVNTDVTEKRKMEAQALRTQRMESVGALASGIAHDLNNVFTPLIMSAQSLAADPTGGDVQPLAEVILATSHRGASMVKQIMTFVRGTAGERVPFRVEHLAKDVVRLLRESFPAGIRVHLSFDEPLRSVIGDATQIHQVLMNLCVNSRDALPSGGDISIQLANFTVDSSFAHTHGAAAPGNYIRITVADTGTGMSEEVRAKIFEPFYTTKPAGRGTGLGLAMVQRIVLEHRGFLDVDTAPGAGTRFHIFLPACEPDEPIAAVAAQEPPRGSGELLLVADDDHSLREIVRTALEAHGYRVMAANDGTDALSTFAVHRSEIAGVVCDLGMPYLDGAACSRAIRNLAPRIPIVLVSGRDSRQLPTSELEALKLECLSKPFTRLDLLVAVHHSLEAARSGSR
ncbi:hybrid sensor histidine kinase/response regulator [Opitutaceae bacterium EW11]|nr:hybrid sensor histidine kinase/response regulator [Opitutaceae bacterium EW11]